MNPSVEYAKGYKGVVMPSYQGQLNDEDISAVIEFIKKFQ